MFIGKADYCRFEMLTSGRGYDTLFVMMGRLVMITAGVGETVASPSREGGEEESPDSEGQDGR